MKKFALLFLTTALFADKVIVPKHLVEVENPWFTGPLLAPSAAVVPVGHFNIEPYVYVIANTGSYDSHGNVQKMDTLWVNNFQFVLQAGLTNWMDIQILPSAVYNYSQHEARWLFYDFPVTVDFQLLAPSHMEDWTPYIKISFTEIFPTGKYQHLNPKKKGTDISGTGSFRSSVGLVFGEVFRLTGIHFLSARLLLFYELPAPVHLEGFNAYGGGYGTNARFFPAQNWEVDLGLELTLTKNWVLACDFVGSWAVATRFSGNPGTDAAGNPATLGIGPSSQYALAPAVEYNWNANVGIIGGAWFTVAGHNAPRFWSAVAAFNYYF
jgi:hypothetical protein